jgi:Sulfotransferase family
VQTAEFSAAEIVTIARRRTGLDDLGDARFLEALAQLLQSINREASLTESGRLAATERFVRLCVNRLRFQADLQKWPAILQETLQPPLIISGLPRVGSTKLHRMLAAGGDFQALLFWQGFNPAPSADEKPGTAEARIAEAARFLEWRAGTNPATNAAHYMAALDPEEDTYLLEYTLHSYWPITYYEVPGFLAWLKQQDRGHAYHYLRQLLQYLQWQFHRDAPRPWLLKSPPNFGYEGELATSLAGAKFVVLHRDPVKVIPSAAAIVREVRRLYCGAPADCKKVAAWMLEEYAQASRRHLAWREFARPDSILDIAYESIHRDELAVARQVYAHYGLTCSTAAQTRMQQWCADNRQHRHGTHRYSLDECGLTAEQIERSFAPYLSQFAHWCH